MTTVSANSEVTFLKVETAVFVETSVNTKYSILLSPESQSYTLVSSRGNLRIKIAGDKL
jgi:hypothetical protein